MMALRLVQTQQRGLLSATPGVPTVTGIPVGALASAVSVGNDSSNLNLGINATGQALGGVSALTEGTAVGAGASVGGFAVAVGAITWDAANAFTDKVLAPMFNAAPTQTINVNGETIPNPALDEGP